MSSPQPIQWKLDDENPAFAFILGANVVELHNTSHENSASYKIQPKPHNITAVIILLTLIGRELLRFN
jgi:hypothetical protein